MLYVAVVQFSACIAWFVCQGPLVLPSVLSFVAAGILICTGQILNIAVYKALGPDGLFLEHYRQSQLPDVRSLLWL